MRTTRSRWRLVNTGILSCCIALSAACSDDDNNGGGNFGPPQTEGLPTAEDLKSSLQANTSTTSSDRIIAAKPGFYATLG